MSQQPYVRARTLAAARRGQVAGSPDRGTEVTHHVLRHIVVVPLGGLVQLGYDERWSWREARRRRRIRRMLRTMDRRSAPGWYAGPRRRARHPVRRGLLVLAIAGVFTAASTHSPLLLVISHSVGWGHSSSPTAYAFLHVQPGTTDLPVSYDGCQPLHFRVNLAGAPSEDPGGRFIFDAVHRVEQASGLHFVYDGPTTERPHWTQPVNGGPILIGFAEPWEVPVLHGDVVGIGGSAMTSRGHFLEYTTGTVTLAEDGIARMLTDPDGAAEARAVVMHELGHVLGLGHVHDPAEVMNPSVSALDWGPGDLRGLKILGSGACF